MLPKPPTPSHAPAAAIVLHTVHTNFAFLLKFFENNSKSKKLPESNVDSTVGFAHGRAKVPDTFCRGQEWNRKYDTCSNEIYDAQVLDQQEVGRSHLQLTHPVGDKT